MCCCIYTELCIKTPMVYIKEQNTLLKLFNESYETLAQLLLLIRGVLALDKKIIYMVTPLVAHLFAANHTFDPMSALFLCSLHFRNCCLPLLFKFCIFFLLVLVLYGL